MPELVEVDIVARGLHEVLKNKLIKKVRCGTNPRFKEAKSATNSRVNGVSRRGKYIMVDLTGGKNMVLHLGMTGQILVNVPADSHIRATFVTESDTVRLRDPRGFGIVKVVGSGEDHGLGTLNSLGPEYYEKTFTPEHIGAVVGRSGRSIKTILLEQVLLAGVGNYICDEALHAAGIHPLQRGLTAKECAKLHQSLLDVVTNSMAHGGVSSRDYVHIDGSKGSYQNYLKVYGRGGLPCKTCGTKLTKSTVSGRGTVYCGSCQKL